MRVIDTHMHYYDGGWLQGEFDGVTVKGLLETMDRYGIEQAWISSMTAFVAHPSEPNGKLYEFCRQAPDRLLPFCVINANYPADVMCDEIKRGFEEGGAVGVKVHPWLGGFPVTHEVMYACAGLCERLGLPVLFHDGTPPYCDGLQIAALGEMFPKLKIILGHAGICDLYHDSIVAAEQNENIYLCFCCSATGDVERVVSRIDSDRLIFGTDFYGIDSFGTYIDNTLGGVTYANIPEDVKEKILYGNALRLMERCKNGI